MIQLINQRIIWIIQIILITTFQVHAKMNTKWVIAEPDTVYLSQSEMRGYYINKSIGEDLSNVALLLSVAAIPSYYVALYHVADGPGRQYNRVSLANDIFLEGIFPLCALIMAAGNYQYSKAAKKDAHFESTTASTWLPFVASAASLVSFSLLANRIFLTDCYQTTGAIEDYEKCDEFPYGSIIGASTLITIPWMRYQFRKSKLRLDGIQIQPTREMKKVSINLRF